MTPGLRNEELGVTFPGMNAISILVLHEPILKQHLGVANIGIFGSCPGCYPWDRGGGVDKETRKTGFLLTIR